MPPHLIYKTLFFSLKRIHRVLWTVKTLMIIACCWLANSAFAQNSPTLIKDTLTVSKKNYEKYTQKTREYSSKSQNDSAAYYGELAVYQAEKLKERQLIIESNIRLVFLYKENLQYEKADSLGYATLPLAVEDSSKLKIYNILTQTHIRRNDLPGLWEIIKKSKAYCTDKVPDLYIFFHKQAHIIYAFQKKNFLEAYNLLNELPDEFLTLPPQEEIWIPYMQFCILSYFQLFQEAQDVYEKHLTVPNRFESYIRSVLVYNLKQQKEYGQLKQLCNETLTSQDTATTVIGLGYIYYSLGLAYNKLGQLDSAKYAFEKGIKISQLQSHPIHLTNNYYGLCELYYDQEDFPTAKKYGEEALKLVNEKELDYNADHHILLADIYSQEANYKRAYELLLKTNEDADQMENEKKEIFKSFFDDKLASEKRTTTLIYESQLKNRGYILTILGICFGFVLLTLYFLRNRNRFLVKEAEYQHQIATQQQLLTEKSFQVNFMTNLTHELRTPVTIISGNTKELLNKQTFSPSTKIILGDILTTSNNLLGTFNHLLALSKNETTPQSIQPNQFLLKGLLDKIQYTITPIVKAKELNYAQEVLFESDLEIITDAQKLETVLLNLLTNAIKFTAAQGTIILKVTEEEQSIQLAIIDTGRGIHQEDIPHLFDRFFQSKHNGNTPEGGIGIGLAICKQYIELLGGSISVTSKLEEGSTFTITMPKTIHTDLPIEPIVFPQLSATVANDPLLASREERTATKKASLLIVEDNIEMCRYLKTILEEAYTLHFAYSGKTALRFLKNKDLPSLIITDWMMLDMNGIALIEKIKSLPSLADIPIIMLTARNLTKDQAIALSTGIDDYLIKPFDATQLEASIHNLLQQSASETVADIYFETPIQLKERYAILQNGKASSLSKKDYDWLVKLEQLIYDHLTDFNLNTTFIADQLFLTTVSVNRKIKQLTGFTTKKYIQEIRYWEARDLLEKGTYDTVKAVSLSVGFKDSKTFSKNFKERFRRSPSDYFKNKYAHLEKDPVKNS